MRPKSVVNKFLTVLEVFLAALVAVPLLTLGIYQLFPAFETWQTETLGFAFPVFVDVVMAGLSVLLILSRRKKLAEYGLRFTPIKYHLDITAACFIPFVLAGFPLGMGVDYRSWGGGLVMAVVQIALLFAIAFLLRRKPSASAAGVAITGLFLTFPIQAYVPPAGKIIALFLTYALFVGFGEEILYRGYVFSRLNEVFGKPWKFFGVAFGWGAVISSLIFGVSHAGILGYLLGLSPGVTLGWSLWTFFGGLVFAYVREKSGSILAPALLHGLPQAIATAAMLFI